MLHMASEDVASLGAVIDALDGQAAKLGPGSQVADIWTCWADRLRPTYNEQAPLGQA
jgi:hypothetical protein